MDIYPPAFKERVLIPAYERHIAWLEPQDKLQRATNGFKSVINFMRAQDQSELYPKFISETNKLDKLRGESTWETFPELILSNYDLT